MREPESYSIVTMRAFARWADTVSTCNVHTIRINVNFAVRLSYRISTIFRVSKPRGVSRR
jgi:hypothetical protein